MAAFLKNRTDRLYFKKFKIIVLLSSILLLDNTARADSPMIPASIIRLPGNESAVIVEKSTQTLFVFKQQKVSSSEGNNQGKLDIVFKEPCSTGEISGIKEKPGDKKTPEGIYFLKEEYEDRYLTPIYGKKAFATDYPNFVDRKKGRKGSSIWLHGTNKKLEPMDSNGCVALENSGIISLAEFVNLDSTPVIMLDSMTYAKKEDLSIYETGILEMLLQWSRSFTEKSYHDYLSFYASDYLPDISWWNEWHSLMKENLGKIEVAAALKNTGIYWHDHVFVVLFDYFLKFNSQEIYVGKRKLFITRQNDRYVITGDLFQKPAEKFSQKDVVLMAAVKSILKPESEKEEVLLTIEGWLDAWSGKNMEEYAAYYADNFYSDNMNKKEWVGRKKALAKNYDYINVSGSRFKVQTAKNRCEVSFLQDYRSDRFNAKGMKTLKLVNKGGEWKIYQESWKKR